MSSRAAKKFGDLAFKASKNIDWDGMAKLIVSKEASKEFANLRRAFEEVNHELETKFNQEPVPIDWEKYRKGIGARIVDPYKEIIESLEVSDDSEDEATVEFKPKFDALLVELKAAEEECVEESDRLDKEIAELRELKKNFATMTAEEYFEKHPELKKKFDDEIRNDYWGY